MKRCVNRDDLVASITDLPLTLWSAVTCGHVSTFPDEKNPSVIRARFPLLTESFEMDVQVINAAYRSWWARVWFPMYAHQSLASFLGEVATVKLPLSGQPGFGKFTEHVIAHHESFSRLKPHVGDPLIGSHLERAPSPHQAENMVQYGAAPRGHRKMLAWMVAMYLKDPKRYRGLPWVLDDTYLPDFAVRKSEGKLSDGDLIHPPSPKRRLKK